MAIEFGMQTNSTEQKLTWSLFEPILAGWSSAIVQYVDRTAGLEVSYYFGERANISVLAAGAWKAGEIAIEEYGTSKRPHSKKEAPSDEARGRCDLYLSLGRRYGVEIEAKQAWVPTHLSAKFHKDRITSALTAALTEANRGWSAARVGCVFFPVHFAADKNPKYRSHPEMHIERELARYLAIEEAALWAWCFPQRARIFRQMDEDSRYKYYPGIVVGFGLGKHFRLSRVDK